MVSIVRHVVGQDRWDHDTARFGRNAAWPSDRRPESRARKCAIFLTMHRSGSSATVRLFKSAGLGLGSAPLLGPHASNPYGHFESIPCIELNRRLQQRLFGFGDELPASRNLLFPFLRTAPLFQLAERYATAVDFEAGERIAEMLGQAGPVAGIKDPRLPLLWGFWQRIIAGMRGVEIVPVLVLRSPHAIACSIAARGENRHSYGDGLLSTERHLRCMRAIADTFPAVEVVRFGSACYEADVTGVADRLDLRLTRADIDRCIDPACVHFTARHVDHPAQTMYDELCRRYAS